MLLYLLALICSAACLVAGLRRMTRGLLLPWLILFGIAIVFQLLFGIWLVYGYYIYVSKFEPTFMLYTYTCEILVNSWKLPIMPLLTGFGWLIM